MTPRRLLVVLPSVLLCLCLFSSVGASDKPMPVLQARADEFRTLAGDLSDFASSFQRSSSPDHAVILGLVDRAMKASDYAIWAGDVIYLSASACESSRNKMRLFAQTRLSWLAPSIDLHLVTLNEILADATSPALAQRGGDLRDKMRELKALLDKPLPE